MREETQTEFTIYTSPRPLAEHVVPELATAAMRQYETRRKPAGLFHSAWNHVEYIINSKHDPDVQEAYFDTAAVLLGEVLQDKEAHQDVRLGAFVLSTYLPLFHQRSAEIETTPQDCEAIYQSLGAALQYMRPLQTDEPPQWRMTEVGTLALSARIRRPELLLYPASPREEHSSVQPLNHDSYFYRDGTKLPIQQKLIPTQKRYDDCITILTLSPLVEKARRAAGVHCDATLADKVNHLLTLIVAETEGLALTKEESRLLNFMSQAVAAHSTTRDVSRVA